MYHDISEFLSVSEAAKILAVSEGTVYRLINSGALPSQAFSKIRRIHREALLAWIEGRKQATKPALVPNQPVV